MQPELLRNSALLFFVSLTLLLGGAANASHTTFDYQVERFEVIGNVPNGLADEFDDGIVTVTSPFGTVDERDGALHLESVGSHDNFPGIPSLTIDRSDAIMDPGFFVANGAGDFTTTTVLRQLTFQEGGFFSLNLAYDNDGVTVELLSLSVFNSSAEINSLIDPIYPILGYGDTGLNLSLTRRRIDLATSLPTFLDHQNINVPTASLVDDILFTMDFEDATDSIIAGISLDNGSSGTAFSQVVLTGLGPSDFGVWTLFGDPMTVVPEPSTALLMSFGLIGLAKLGRRTH